MRRREMSDGELSAMFCRGWKESGGNLDFCLRVVFEAGRRAGGKPARTLKSARVATREAHRRSRAQEAATFLRLRWMPLLEAVAQRNDTTVGRLLTPGRTGKTAGDWRAIQQAIWLLRQVTDYSYITIGGIVNRHHTSVIDAWQRAEASIAERPALRDELLALVPAGRVGMERAA